MYALVLANKATSETSELLLAMLSSEIVLDPLRSSVELLLNVPLVMWSFNYIDVKGKRLSLFSGK